MKTLKEYVEREFDAGTRLRKLVRCLEQKGFERRAIVSAWKGICRQVGYSRVRAMKFVTHRPYGDWVELSRGLFHDARAGLFWKGGKVRDARTAEWAGWIGKGDFLKRVIREETNEEKKYS